MEKPPALPALLPAPPGTMPHRRAMAMGLLTVLAPMLAPVLVLTGWSAVVERSAAEARLQDAADALTRMVEGDLATVADSLAMAVRLGSLPNDPERFRAPAQRLRDARPGWRSVFLATSYAQVLMDSEGVPAAQPPYAATVRTAIVEGRAAVSGRLGEPVLLAVALPLMRDGMVELASIGAAISCPISESSEDRMAVTAKLGAFKTSMLQDVEAGRPIEIEALLGAPREIARTRNIATPALDRLYGATKLLSDSPTRPPTTTRRPSPPSRSPVQRTRQSRFARHRYPRTKP